MVVVVVGTHPVPLEAAEATLAEATQALWVEPVPLVLAAQDPLQATLALFK